MTSESFLEPKAVLDSVKSSSWKFFNFRVADGDVDRSYVHCKLCFDTGNRKRAQVKYCEGTTNLTLHLKTWHKADYKAMVEKEEPPKKPPSILLKLHGAISETYRQCISIGNISGPEKYIFYKYIGNISGLAALARHSLGR